MTDRTAIKEKILKMSNEDSNQYARTCISRALLDLLKTKELESVTITEIINASGVSRATFYRNFKDKHDVLYEVERYIIDRIRMLSVTVTNQNRHEAILNFLNNVKTHHKIFQIFIRSGHIPYALIEETIPGTSETRSNAFEHYAHISYLHGMAGIIDHWVKSDMKESPEELAEIIKSIYPEKF